MLKDDPKLLFENIKNNSNLSESEIYSKIDDIKKKYHGLLSDVGAYIMLSKQLNISLEEDKTPIVTISNLSTDFTSVSLYARVKSIPPLKTYKTKDGKEGKIQSIYIQDDTGFTRLNLWQEATDILKDLSLDKNNLIFIKDAYVTEYNEKKELSLRYGGEIIKEPKDAPSLKEIPITFLKIKDISETKEQPIDTAGRVINLYPLNSFTRKDGTTSNVLNFLISDGTKKIRCVAWDGWATYINSNITKGNIIKLNDVIIKEGLYDLEVHLSWLSTVIKEPTLTYTIPPLSELIEDIYKQVKIIDMEPDSQVKIEGVVISVMRNNLIYYKCPTCKEKVFLINNDFICEACGTAVTPVVNLFGAINIDDGSNSTKVLFFGELVEKIFNIKTEELQKELSTEDLNNLFEKVEQKVIGKKVIVTGRAKFNSYSSQVEVMSNSVDFVDL